MNPLEALHDHGQSFWLDALSRTMVRGGTLARWMREDGLRGVTSNPAIFHAAITGGEAYDADLDALLSAGRTPMEAYEEVVTADIRDACDVLRPVWEASGGVDGLVSLEVSPHLARDTRGTVEEACRLHQAVDRPNVLIKIPGTVEGIPAIEECLVRGVDVNVTLLFSVERYEAVHEAYLRALERRLEAGQGIGDTRSVASFFLSRIDVLVDGLLRSRLPDPAAAAVLGRAAIANARVAYARFEEVLEGERWKRLASEGAAPQRLLWASTSTKNPLYDEVRYVEPLVGPHTVNTMPEATADAFRRRGRVATTVREGREAAGETLEALTALGIPLPHVTWQLEEEGIRKFARPFDALMRGLARRAETLHSGRAGRITRAFGAAAPIVEDAWRAGDEAALGRRIDARSPTPWTGGRSDGAGAEEVGNRLGWLDAPGAFRASLTRLEEAAGRAHEEGFDRVVVLGMGGSSLSSVVAADVFGRRAGWPELEVLDSTDPEAVRALRDRIDPSRSLFVVASKSGTTTETLAFYRYFRGLVESAVGDEAWPGHFLAITDPETPLAGEATKLGFRDLFLNPEDIGGRYSVLSWFGLVPMALAGIDVGEVLDRAETLARISGGDVPTDADPGLGLGVALGALARRGRDKLTFVTDPPLAAFGLWAEQLVAESTGKEGRGIVPVTGEPPLDPGEYGADRVFVGLSLAGEESVAPRLDALERAGHPVLRTVLPDAEALGAEFYRWELATAAASAVLGVNAFDEPNVREAKRATRELLEEHERRGGFAEEEPRLGDGDLRAWWWNDDPGEPGAPERVADALLGLTAATPAGGYVALLPYLHETLERRELLDRLRLGLLREGGVATTLGFGPRYLHSTGQLHKGGPEGGLHIVLTGSSAEPGRGEPIPGEVYDFATLLRAQALGDIRALRDGGRRTLRIDLGDDVEAGLSRLAG